MRLRFDFDLPRKRLIIPINYNHLLQAMIYHNLNHTLADFLHNRGFEYQKRIFRMFTFSRLYGRFQILKSNNSKSFILFDTPIYFYLSSPFEQLLQEFANRMVSGSSLHLDENPLYLSSVQVFMPPLLENNPTPVKMLSPITVRTTSPQGEESNTHKTHYYSPLEPRFSELVRRNLWKKYLAFTQSLSENEIFDENPPSNLNIKPLRFSEQKNFNLVIYKEYIIKGYTGIYEISGPRELKQFAWDCGIGERNSQGFGMFDTWNPDEKRSEYA